MTRGEIEFDDLACVEPDEWVDPCAAPDVFESESMPGVRYATASAFASHTQKTDVCDELCAAEPACRFYAIETTRLILGMGLFLGAKDARRASARRHYPGRRGGRRPCVLGDVRGKRGALCEVLARAQIWRFGSCTSSSSGPSTRPCSCCEAAAGADATTIDPQTIRGSRWSARAPSMVSTVSKR